MIQNWISPPSLEKLEGISLASGITVSRQMSSVGLSAARLQTSCFKSKVGTYRSISGWPRNCHIDGQVLVISVDGCDQSKFAVPRFEGLKTVATLSL